MPRHVVDLIKLPKAPGVSITDRKMVEEILAIKEAVKAKLQDTRQKNKVASDKGRRAKVSSVGDDVMVFLH